MEQQLACSDVESIISREILGSLLLDGSSAAEQCQRLRAEMFVLWEHKLLFRRAMEYLAENADIDPVALWQYLQRTGEASSIANGLAAIDDLTNGVVRRSMLGQRVSYLVEAWKRRTLMARCDECVSSLRASGDVGEALDRLQAQALDLVHESAAEDDPSVLTNTKPELERWLDLDEGQGIPYGLPVLDRLTGGMYEGEVTVVGARNGVGKTSFIAQLMHTCGRTGIAVDAFSLEMGRGPLMHRLWAMETWENGTGVHQRVLRRKNEATAEDRRRVSQAALRVGGWPIRIFKQSSMDVTAIAAQIRYGVHKLGVKVACIDYAQRVSAEGRDDRLRVKKVSETLTALAKDTGVHVVLLSQLRKVPHEVYSKPPTMADLRESSQLGDDAHAVVLIHRGYDESTGGLDAHGEVVVPKQRSGETRAVPVRFDGRSGMFYDDPQQIQNAA